jgi:hypothetical protein
MTAGLCVVAAQDRRTLVDAQRDFYNARYEAAAALVLELRESEAQDLPTTSSGLPPCSFSSRR